MNFIICFEVLIWLTEIPFTIFSLVFLRPPYMDLSAILFYMDIDLVEPDLNQTMVLSLSNSTTL
jgi:hypothetical protein